MHLFDIQGATTHNMSTTTVRCRVKKESSAIGGKVFSTFFQRGATE
jgi:hypothetical protein